MRPDGLTDYGSVKNGMFNSENTKKNMHMRLTIFVTDMTP